MLCTRIPNPMRGTSSLFLLRELIRRDFTSRYAGSLLGLVWSFVQPLWQLALFVFVFSIVVRLPLDGEATGRFWVFLLCGLLPWMAIQEGITRSCTVITDNATLVGKMRFPSELLVVVVTTTALLHQAITLGFFLIALAVTGEISWGSLILLPPALVLQVLLTLGLGFLLAATHVFFRDTVQLLNMVTNAWFYLTPIVFPLAIVPEQVRALMFANPLTVLVTLYRQAFLGAGTPLSAWHLAFLVFAVLAIFGAGLWTFRHFKPAFADEI